MEVFPEAQSPEGNEELLPSLAVAPKSISPEKSLVVVPSCPNDEEFLKDTVEVSGITRTDLDPEMIKLYFTSPKSGGNREKDIKNYEQLQMGVVQIQFDSAEGVYIK